MIHDDKKKFPGFYGKRPEDTFGRSGDRRHSMRGMSYDEGQRTLTPKPEPKGPLMPGVTSTVAPRDGKWMSQLDPEQTFASREEAVEFEETLPMPPPISEKGRPRTIFSYMMTKSTNQLSSLGVHQGPHVVGYAAHSDGLFGAKDKISLEAIASEQVMHPDDWAKAVEEEFASHGVDDIFSGKSEDSDRALRARRDYIGLWLELQRHLQRAKDPSERTVKGGDQGDDPMDLIHELSALQPHTVYGYACMDKLSKKHFAGKGENRNLSDPKNVDPHARTFFGKGEGFDEHVEGVKGLLDSDWKAKDEENVEMDEVSEDMDVSKDEVKKLDKDRERPLSELLPKGYTYRPRSPKPLPQKDTGGAFSMGKVTSGGIKKKSATTTKKKTDKKRGAPDKVSPSNKKKSRSDN